MITTRDVRYEVGITGQEHDLPQVRLCVETRGPIRAQDYLTPAEARELAEHLLTVARRADA